MIMLLAAIGAVIIDIVVTTAVGVGLAIASGWSGRFSIGPWVLIADSARNAFIAAVCALVLRSLWTDTPFLGLFPVRTLPGRALDLCRRLHDALRGASRPRRTALLVIVLAVSLILKVTLAYFHPGFWTGDDVEIHEMTFAQLFGYPWQASVLRSPIYPLGFVYPVQALLVMIGQRDPATLVWAARCEVALFTIATLWLTYHVAYRWFGGAPVALLSVFILATNKLHVMTGTTELPRPVASFFVLAAFWLLSASRRWRTAGLAGALIGVAAAMRFSEEIFLLPAVLQLCVARRWRDLLPFMLGFAALVVCAFGGLDAVYWGEPFFSLRHIVDFTLTRRLSTRGFQPWYEYLRAIPSWTNLAVAALAVYGGVKRQYWTLAGWAAIPLATLSLLPHKEPRYLVPILPYVSMLAAAAWWEAIVWLRRSGASVSSGRRERTALVLCMTVIAVLLTEPMDYVLPRGDQGIVVARYIAAEGSTDGVLAAPAWNIGGRLYLPQADPLIDLEAGPLQDRTQLAAALQTPALHWLVFQDRDVQQPEVESLIANAGFTAIPPIVGAPDYRLFRRR